MHAALRRPSPADERPIYHTSALLAAVSGLQVTPRAGWATSMAVGCRWWTQCFGDLLDIGRPVNRSTGMQVAGRHQHLVGLRKSAPYVSPNASSITIVRHGSDRHPTLQSRISSRFGEQPRFVHFVKV